MAREYDFDKMVEDNEAFSMGKYVWLHGNLFFLEEKGNGNEHIFLNPKVLAGREGLGIKELEIRTHKANRLVENCPKFLEKYQVVVTYRVHQIEANGQDLQKFANDLKELIKMIEIKKQSTDNKIKLEYERIQGYCCKCKQSFKFYCKSLGKTDRIMCDKCNQKLIIIDPND